MKTFLSVLALSIVNLSASFGRETFEPLFTGDGAPQGWLVREWSDLAKPAPDGLKWEMRDGILHGSSTRGTWLVSEKEFEDFVLEYEFKLGPQGNSGLAIRTPLKGDPAF